MLTLTLLQASRIVDEALAYARRHSFAPITVAVLDVRGCVVALKMEDGSSLLRPDLATGTAANLLFRNWLSFLAAGAGKRGR